MMRRLRSIFGQKAKPEIRETHFAPDTPFFAIGDLHGCADLLEKMLQEISARSKRDPLVFLGDYVDRGPDSAGVLKRVFQLQQDRPDDIVALRGNHEDMLLEFLDDPAGYGLRYLDHGGVQTLQSFGIPARGGATDLQQTADWAAALEDQLTEALLNWLRELPAIWRNGNIACVHAGIDPQEDIEAQEPRHLVWGHPGFVSSPLPDGLTIIHGHICVPAPRAVGGRVSLDTCAYRTGVLSAAHISTGTCHFLSVS